MAHAREEGTNEPTSLTYGQALEEALCSGWIDGRRQAVDAATYRQHLTPRRARSVWSQRNVDLVAALTAAGRMRPRGRREVERAQADGRWDRAYAGQAAATVPDDLAAAVAASAAAAQRFAALTRAERYAAIHPVITAPSAAARRARVAAVVARLASGD